MDELNTTRHTITEHPMTTFWRDTNADLAKRGLAPAMGREISHHWITTKDPAEAAAAIARGRVPLLVALNGGRE